jgi:cellobiose phosphorylase
VGQRNRQPAHRHRRQRKRQRLYLGGKRARVPADPWHNDPLSDASGEALYIRDEETGVFWSPTPLPARGKSGYVCRHGFGYSVFEHYEAGIASELFTYVAMDAPVKFVVVKLHNQSKRARSLSLTGYWELVLGEWRHTNLMHIVTESDLPPGRCLPATPTVANAPAGWCSPMSASASGR